MPEAKTTSPKDLVFVGLYGRVIAMDRYDGHVVWEWQAPRRTRTFMSLMLDGDRLLVGTYGYIYCLDPVYGQLVWENPLKGYGVGIVSFASANGATDPAAAAQIAAQQAAAAASAAAASSAAAGAAASG